MIKLSIHCRDFITHEESTIPDIEFDEREWTEQIWTDPWREACHYNSQVIKKVITEKYPELYLSGVDCGLYEFNLRSNYRLKMTVYIEHHHLKVEK